MWWIPLAAKLLDLFVKKLDPSTAIEAEKTLAEIDGLAREAEARAEAAREEAFAAFIASTQPKSEFVYIWANTAIALIRPGLAVFSLVSPFLWPAQWRDFVSLVGQNAPWSIFVLSPLIIWVGGRDMLRLGFGLTAMIKNGGHIPSEVLPPGLPAQPSPAPRPAPPVVKPKPKAPVWVPPDLPPVEGDTR